MIFYRVEGTINNISEKGETRSERREYMNYIALKSNEFNNRYNGYCFFMASASEKAATIGVIAEQFGDINVTVQAYLDYINCDLRDVVITEITLYNMKSLLKSAARMDFIADEDEMIEKYGFDKFGKSNFCGIAMTEKVISECDKTNIFAKADKLLMKRTLEPELKRIYMSKNTVKTYGHPVHYMMQTDDVDTQREVYTLLLQALYEKHRLNNKRFVFLDFRVGSDTLGASFETLYKLSIGGALVIRYTSNDDTDEDAYASNERDSVESICEMIKKYRNRVLTIVCLQRECKKIKSLFYDHLGSVSMIEIKEEFAERKQAVTYLKTLAEEYNVKTDSSLFSELEDGKGYLAPELNILFNEWYDNKLKTTIYPQYKDIAVVGREVMKSAPKGNAYDELMEMIGLSDAKSVIQKALNYYKMQKLFEEKGLKRDTPAMHMVFSGNPGTAKTTVARLFARIMKDNELLSTGQLVEVGRGDLIGKYVGWTAKIVQKKFEAASGGVLFIDEAYSLIDEHNGSFGDEAINTIVQQMENHREDVIVIFAGYPDKMEELLQKNPGLRSRIAFHVHFSDYSTSDLCQIATLICKSKGFSLDDEAIAKLNGVFEEGRKQRDFGNGRYVRNIVEQARMNQASRLLECNFEDITTKEITTLKAVDIVAPKSSHEEKRKIGFAC